MYYIGSFNEEQVKNGYDKKIVAQKQKLFPHLKYVKTKMIVKTKKIVGIELYLTDKI